MFVLHNGLPVFVQVGLLTAWQLEQGGQAVQIGHFVEGAQQEIHHHQTHEQVDWGERQETQGSQEVICSTAQCANILLQKRVNR